MGKKIPEKELDIMKFKQQPKVITKTEVVYRNNPNLWIYIILALMTGVLITLGTQNLLIRM